MSRHTRASFAILAATAAAIVLSGCSATPTPSPSATSKTPAPSAGSKTAKGQPEVPGYAFGEFPPVPLFRLPDLSLLDAASASGFALDIRKDFSQLPGVSVSAAHCDSGGRVMAVEGTASLYGDGSGTYVGTDGSMQNYGDGSGSFTLNGVTVQNYGDGSGSYVGNGITIKNYGDGSGSYTDDIMAVHIYGDGSGSYTENGATIKNYGDGSGSYAGEGITITNYGDGSGSYEGEGIAIQNYGDGTGKVNGSNVPLDPIAPVPALGVFPPLAALQPIASCGTVITFDAGVFFDFDKSDIRPDAATSLETVAAAFTEYAVPRAVVSGHTDAIGTAEYNQTLSEKRARAVVSALAKSQAKTKLTAEGYGATRPVAANEIEGKDNPAGRQLNRRVEIYIPDSL